MANSSFCIYQHPEGDIAFRMANIISNTQPNRKINNVVEFISDPITDDPIKQSTILVSDINQVGS